MADNDGAAQALVRIELVDYLPGGRACYPVEIEGELVWLILATEMTERLRAEMVEYLKFLADQQFWTQNWDGPAGEPPQIRHAS
ncbi:hypothetical protein OG897_06410 [Streptomyces sp. NBC_00237]|uniref:hypothetical protein n=1 Tax=Streptomyces sp. NBC_00237 TaxID=2975687 RepID=UPI00225001FA|nr:hypothetical protein [Streptomyces sp. NBC_00237]MCX5201095.1 hypothetical protein [Streptomyces sp. NBC_00237]